MSKIDESAEMAEACRDVAVAAERVSKVSAQAARTAILQGKDSDLALRWVEDLHQANIGLRDALEDLRDLQAEEAAQRALGRLEKTLAG